MTRHLNPTHRYSLTVHGANGSAFAFDIGHQPIDHVESWRSAGLEVDEIVASAPEWMPGYMMAPWFALCDFFDFRWRDALGWFSREDEPPSTGDDGGLTS